MACAATVVGAEAEDSASAKSKSVEFRCWAREGTEGSDGNGPAITSGGGMGRGLPFFRLKMAMWRFGRAPGSQRNCAPYSFL